MRISKINVGDTIKVRRRTAYGAPKWKDVESVVVTKVIPATKSTRRLVYTKDGLLLLSDSSNTKIEIKSLRIF